MKVFNVDDSEQWWYAAESADHALRLHLEPIIGKNLPEDLTSINDKVEKNCGYRIEDIEISELSPDTVLKVRSEDDNTVEEKTAAEWAADGIPGLIACTVY